MDADKGREVMLSSNTLFDQKWTVVWLVVVACFALGMFLENWMVLLMPMAAGLAIFTLYYPKYALYFLFISIPFTNDYPIIWGLSLDLPSEPFMMLLTGLGVLIFIAKSRDIPWYLLKNSLVLLIVAIWSWSVFCTVFSTDFTVSLKYVLAKLWFIIPCFFAFLIFLYEEGEQLLLRVAQLIVWAMVVSSIIVFAKHLQYGLSFEGVNKAVIPLFRNHVTYACVLILSLPWAFYLMKEKPNSKILYGIVCIWLSVCIYFSYTRLVIGALVISSASLLILRYRLIRMAIGLAIGVTAILTIGLLQNGQYIDYAPDYNKTISHYEFDDLLEATRKGQDISTAERFHRWVAGYHMIEQKPLVGFGPGTFYFSYKKYTESQFRTYVSRNDEKSGIHNYYLMLAVEQGIIGSMLFVLLLISVFVKLDKLERKNPHRTLHQVLFFSLVSILLILTLNDMIETVHVGTFFFIAMSIIVFLDYRSRPI